MGSNCSMSRHKSFIRKSLYAMIFTWVSCQVQAASPFTVDLAGIEADKALPGKFLSNAFGCTGDNVRPALNWLHAPAGTRSFAVTFYDKDAPTGSGFWQWVAVDIPAEATGLKENGLPAGTRQQRNDAGTATWLGPCPPAGTSHHYEFSVHALDIASLAIPKDASAALAGYLIYQHTLERAKTTLVVSR